MTYEEEIAAVERYAQKWGVRVLHRSPTKEERHTLNIVTAPEHGYLDWQNQTIYWPVGSEWVVLPCALLHEVAHAISPLPPDKVDDIKDGLVAHDHQVYQTIGIDPEHWKEWMSSFYVGDEESQTTWGDVSLSEQEQTLATSLAGAIRQGLLASDGTPTFASRQSESRS